MQATLGMKKLRATDSADAIVDDLPGGAPGRGPIVAALAQLPDLALLLAATGAPAQTFA